MSVEQEIHEKDIGTVFEVTIKDALVVVDISTATTKEMIFLKGDGTVATVTAAFSDTGTDGKIKYVVPDADFLVPAGKWQLQARIVLPTGDWHTSIHTFQVHENLD